MTEQKMTAVEADALKELSNIGMGHAATALSQLIGERVDLRVPKVTVTDIAQVPEIMGGSEREVVGITLQILGGASGSILLTFPRESAMRLVLRLLGVQSPERLTDELGVSTLKEVGNILASAFLSALGGQTGLVLIPSVPQFALDMAGAIVDGVLIELSQEEDLALMVEAEFTDTGRSTEPLSGQFFLIPDPGSLHLLLQAARIRP